MAKTLCDSRCGVKCVGFRKALLVQGDYLIDWGTVRFQGRMVFGRREGRMFLGGFLARRLAPLLDGENTDNL